NPGVGREERVVVDLAPVPARPVDAVPADLYESSTDRDGGDDFAGDGAGGNAHGRLACRGSPAAPIVADAVFLPVGEIRVPGPELVLDVGVVAAALVDVVDDQRDRGARGHLAAGVVLEHSRADAHGVGLAAL